MNENERKVLKPEVWEKDTYYVEYIKTGKATEAQVRDHLVLGLVSFLYDKKLPFVSQEDWDNL